MAKAKPKDTAMKLTDLQRMCFTDYNPPARTRRAQEAANLFVRALRHLLKPAQFEEMCKRNRDETDLGTCHSHDFCDANVVMAEAMDCLGLGWNQQTDEYTEGQCSFWNFAWDLAMPMIGRRVH